MPSRGRRMLDEPSLGLAPVMTDVTFEKIGEIHKMGTAILLAEQNVSRALSLVQRAYVLESGNVIMHGSSTELADTKQLQAANLGMLYNPNDAPATQPSLRLAPPP